MARMTKGYTNPVFFRFYIFNNILDVATLIASISQGNLSNPEAAPLPCLESVFLKVLTNKGNRSE